MRAAAPFIGLIRLYQWLVRPLLGANCRFEPVCSDYACEAMHRHGLLAGGRLTLWRLLRCNPWNRGGADPVPPAATAG